MIDYRFSFIVDYPNQQLEMNYILEQTYMDTTYFFAEVTKLNEIALSRGHEQLLVKDAHVFVPKKLSEGWVNILFSKHTDIWIFNEHERQAMIYLMTFIENEELSVFHFQDTLLVSKNTILKDIKNLRLSLGKQTIQLNYSRKKGFYLSGDETTIRSFAYQFVHHLLGKTTSKHLLYEYVFYFNHQLYAEVHTWLAKTIQRFHLTIVPSRFEEMVYFISYLISRIKRHSITFEQSDKLLLKQLSVYQASQYFLENFSTIDNRVNEELYFTLLLITVVQGNVDDFSLNFLLECSGAMIYEMERLAAIQFKEYKKLLLELFYHLVPAYFRIRFNLTINNGLIDEIKMQYSELFELTKSAILPLEQLVHTEIPDDEIGYFTILFGGEILNQKAKKHTRKLNALILCPSGISSSLIMQSELKVLFPQITFKKTSSLENFSKDNLSLDYDLIFSSVPIQTTKKVYVIKPIMSQLDKHLLVRNVQEDFLFTKTPTLSIHEMLDILIPHIELKKGVTKAQLQKILQKKINISMKRKEDNRPMLSELLTTESIALIEQQDSWENAIKQAAQPLIKANKVTDDYITAMIDKVKDYGPFIDIGHGVALPHARPEDGVNELGMSLLKVTEPVLLNNDETHPIHLFICLAAIDNETHLKALASLTKILSDITQRNALLEARTKEEIIKIIIEGENKQ